MKKITTTVLISIAVTSIMGGCSLPYRIDIDQGNTVEQRNIDQLTIGISKDQVQQILGTALLTDTFHENRWDYIQQYKNGKTNKLEKSKVSLYFPNGMLSQVSKNDYSAIKTEPLPYSVNKGK